MDESLFQCVPNVSEGRRAEVVEACAQALRAVPGAHLLDYSSDRDHHRSVFTLVGRSRPLREAILALFAVAAEHIDLALHQGAHPRIGAVDVVPFVPLLHTPLEAARTLAREVAEDVARRFELPIYLYEESALRPERRSLAWLRRGGLQGLEGSIATPERSPDLGPQRLHPRLGASVIGARRPLVAFNVLLDTADVEVARSVARRVRERDGGLRNLRALGIYLAERRLAQVSMNLLDPDRTALYTAVEMVRMEARRYGARVLSTELIGLMPLESVAQAAAYYLQSEDLGSERILESRLLEILVQESGSEGPAPGQTSGAAGAWSGTKEES